MKSIIKKTSNIPEDMNECRNDKAERSISNGFKKPTQDKLQGIGHWQHVCMYTACATSCIPS